MEGVPEMVGMWVSEVSGETSPEYELHDPIGWGPRRNRKVEKREALRQACSILLEQVHFLLLPLVVDIRLQIHQPLTADLHQPLLRELPGL